MYLVVCVVIPVERSTHMYPVTYRRLRLTEFAMELSVSNDKHQLPPVPPLRVLDHWFPKWAVPPPWGRWSRSERLGGDRGPS